MQNMQGPSHVGNPPHDVACSRVELWWLK